MRTTTCGAAISWRKHELASAAISATGSAAISPGASLRATASATSMDSASSRASIACRLAVSAAMPCAMRSQATDARPSILASAASRPLRYASVSARASAASCTASATTGLVGAALPEAKSSSNRNLTGALIGCKTSIDQFFVAAVLRDHDLALGGEVLGEVDQQPLRLVDVAQAHGAERLHVVDQHLGGARRHVAEEELPHRVGRALQRHRELVLVDMAHQCLSRAGVELDQVVECEHQRLDALGRLAVLLLQRGDEARLGLAVEIVEDLRHHLVRVAPAGLRQARHELGAQRVLQPLDHVLL